MEATVKNILKSIVFYLTITMGVFTLVLDVDRIPFTGILVWFTILGVLGFTTYNMCKGKSDVEIKKFTGIDFSED